MTAEPDVFGCVLSTGRKDRDGYAFHGSTRAHIAAWVALNGPVPEGLVLDHLCRRRNCCAPHHLEPVTQSENEMRKRWRYRAARTHCAKGHPLSSNGIVTPEGGRVCRQCNRDALGGREQDPWYRHRVCRGCGDPVQVTQADVLIVPCPFCGEARPLGEVES